METSVLKQIRKSAGRFIEPKILKAGRVLEVRAWETAAITEIDLHLPMAAIQEWKEVPYIKFRVDDLCYRDYTPFGWDAETATCSLLIDTAHEGPGSRWAKSLRQGDIVQYLKIEGTHQVPHPTDLVVGLGDASSLGHLLALRQLTLPASRFEGAILLSCPRTGQLIMDYFGSSISIFINTDQFIKWLVKQQYCTAHTWFYLAGNDRLVTILHRMLKDFHHPNIKIKGFWS